jgi:hypothetical protein
MVDAKPWKAGQSHSGKPKLNIGKARMGVTERVRGDGSRECSGKFNEAKRTLRHPRHG